MSLADREAARAALVAIGETDPHTTTVLAAAALLEMLGHAVGGESVLDVGAGTAILAALARFSGAGRVVGIEREAALVELGRRRHPDVELIIGDAALGLPTGRFGIVVANLPSPTLERLVGDLVATARFGVIVTGVRLVQGSSLRRTLERAGLRDVRSSAQNGWCAYRGVI